MTDVPRGLPRPLNSRGLPIPYLSLSPERLGEKDPSRAIEVPRDWLCQVCGNPAGEPAYAITRTDYWNATPEDCVVDHGLLHDECLRLALRHCPHLSERIYALKVLCVRHDDVTLTSAFRLEIPVEDQESLGVDVNFFLDPDAGH